MKNFQDKIIYNWQTLKRIVDKYREKGKIIGFTNGCFDILHKGHVMYLYETKQYCDILIIGVNSDESVRRIKGENKPVNTLEDRMIVLSALEFVDFVVPFEEDTPISLIQYIKPDFYFKGGDYKDKIIPELKVIEKYQITYKILTFVPEVSTTKIIYKIKGGK
ncbi:MAG: D-glycero-beta-D-manno-heptose 1-phosphate adenylyltransferase [bacterium]